MGSLREQARDELREENVNSKGQSCIVSDSKASTHHHSGSCIQSGNQLSLNQSLRPK